MTEREKLNTMIEARKAGSRKRRLVIGVNTPNEFRDALRKAERGEIEKGFLVRLEREKRDALNHLASEADISTVEFLRVLIDAALTLGLSGVRVFIDVANDADDLENVFKKARGGDDPEGKKSSESLKARLKRLSPDNPDEPEHDADDDEPKRKKKKKKQGAEK